MGTTRRNSSGVCWSLSRSCSCVLRCSSVQWCGVQSEPRTSRSKRKSSGGVEGAARKHRTAHTEHLYQRRVGPTVLDLGTNLSYIFLECNSFVSQRKRLVNKLKDFHQVRLTLDAFFFSGTLGPLLPAAQNLKNLDLICKVGQKIWWVFNLLKKYYSTRHMTINPSPWL